MKMSEVKYLNDRHKDVIEQYLLRLKKIMYFATENAESGKYQDFLDILSAVYAYSNSFHSTMLKNKDVTQEFLFLIPNMSFYSCIGYLTALKNKINADDVKNDLEKVTVITEDVTGSLADILIDDLEEEELIKQIQQEHLTKN